MFKLFKFIGLVLALVLVSIFCAAIFVWVLALFAFVVGMGFIAWVCGAHITIKEHGKKIGYIRYTKFYPTQGY